MSRAITRFVQVILLEEAWSELFLLNAVQWCLPLESSPLFSAPELTALTLSPHQHPHSGLHLQNTTGKPSQVAADVRHLHDTLQRYKAVMVDPAEFACMKAIVLFRPGKTRMFFSFYSFFLPLFLFSVIRCLSDTQTNRILLFEGSFSDKEYS